MPAENGWRTFEVGDVLTFSVPAEVQLHEGQSVDSLAGVLNGDRYQITYDYGRFSEPVEDNRTLPGFAVKDARIGSRRSKIASFRDDGNELGLPFARLLRVEDGGNALTLRVSCRDEAACSIADAIFESVQFR